jgi:hypothetical protein
MTSFGFPKQFDKNVSFVIATFLAPKPYKFLDWIDPAKLNWETLSGWVDQSILIKHPRKINWFAISINENATSLVYKMYQERQNVYNHLEQSLNPFYYFMQANDGLEECFWNGINKNCSNFAMNLLLNHPDKINLEYLSGNSNPTAITLLEQNPNKIDWNELCLNPGAIHILNQRTKHFTTNIQLINWYNLCCNPSAIDIIKRNRCHIKWGCLSTNSAAIEMIMTEKNIEENWSSLCENSAAINFLKYNQKEIDYDDLSFNRAIIELDLKVYQLLQSAFTKMVYNL